MKPRSLDRTATLVLLGAAVVAYAACTEGPAPGGAAPGATPGEALAQEPAVPVSGGQSVRTSMPPAPPPSLAAPIRDVPLDELGYTVGEAGAPLRVIEFSDFACGYCRQFHLEVFPTIEKEYVASGKVQWKYVPMILGIFGPNAEVAARAGECALEQDRFPPMRDRIFRDQPEWKRAAEPLPVLAGFAGEVGLDVDRWTRCMREDWRRDRVASGTRTAVEAGVRGTPTFFIVGHTSIPGSLPLDLFRQTLDRAYENAVGR